MFKKNLIIIFSLFLSIQNYSNSEINDKQVIVLKTYKHHKPDFTQGLEIINNYLFESTGLHGVSSLKKLKLKDGNILKKLEIPHYFSEGITIWNGIIYNLSWKNKKVYQYNSKTFKKMNKYFTYEGEGWGLTHNKKFFIMSDGSDQIFFRRKKDFKVIKILKIKDKSGKKIKYLNELEYVDGFIYANIWYKPYIVVINEKSGFLEYKIDLSNLKCENLNKTEDDMIYNGIAYHKKSKSFYITGKRCPLIYNVLFK